MRILAIIPARGGSKGLPGKNVRPLAGKPLIAHTVELAKRCPSLTRTVVSTDSEEIAKAAQTAKGDVPWLRPAELATDTATTAGVVKHALQACEKEEGKPYDSIVVLQATSPLRTVGDVEGAIKLFQSSKAPAVISVCEFEHPLSWAVLVGDDDALTPHPAAAKVDYTQGRQSLAKVYRFNGAVYVYSREVALAARGGMVAGARAYVMPVERSVDIDTLADFKIVEALMNS